ncbi:hypothetical protein [Mycobacterium sp. IDR2000157661]|uniref:hypothetical protein n=1 Tax=Mycobacterium sp. IDR2000157661 TaxID=2867005 RepID=UPI001EEC686B|nr:hypothetical protein [Mycobacterium sp. IDR2000157661]ULE31135.1 hypothetical protein K3G64_00145 [Mycobacterium sp. IDR2000157661]
MPTLDDLEARVAALEASQADYRAVLAAVNALGANQREMAMTLVDQGRDLAELKNGQTELRAGQRSLEDNVAEIKDLLVRALDR